MTLPEVGERRTHRMFGPGEVCSTTDLYKNARMLIFKPDKIDTTIFSHIVLVDAEALKEVSV